MDWETSLLVSVLEAGAFFFFGALAERVGLFSPADSPEAKPKAPGNIAAGTFQQLRSTVDTHGKMIDQLAAEVAQHEATLVQVRNNMARSIDALDQRVERAWEVLQARLLALESRSDWFVGRHAEMEHALAKHNARLDMFSNARGGDDALCGRADRAAVRAAAKSTGERQDYKPPSNERLSEEMADSIRLAVEANGYQDEAAKIRGKQHQAEWTAPSHAIPRRVVGMWPPNEWWISGTPGVGTSPDETKKAESGKNDAEEQPGLAQQHQFLRDRAESNGCKPYIGAGYPSTPESVRKFQESLVQSEVRHDPK